MNLPAVTAKEVIRILLKKGFVQVRQSGSHIIFRHPDGRRTTAKKPYVWIRKAILHRHNDIGEGVYTFRRSKKLNY